MGGAICWLLGMLVAGVAGALHSQPQPAPCNPDELAVYRLHLQTHWSRERFPKQYPEWRPPAGWSKLVGRTHDSSYWLYREGEMASPGLQTFAEKGQSDGLEAADQAGVYDEFTAPPVPRGAGRTVADFFLDGNHSLVSVAVRVVPSPDWFIGIDSLDLCRSGHWIEALAIQVDPMDAGTDNGFTFTSPNWPSDPKEPVSRITSKRPNHPANSFYYPNQDELPPIATFTFVKCPGAGAGPCPSCPCATTPSDTATDWHADDLTSTPADEDATSSSSSSSSDYWTDPTLDDDDMPTSSATPPVDQQEPTSPRASVAMEECLCSCGVPPANATTNSSSGGGEVPRVLCAALPPTEAPTPTFAQSEVDIIDELLEERVYHLSSESGRNATAAPRDPLEAAEMSNEVGQPLGQDSFRTNKTRRSKGRGGRQAKHCQLSDWSEWSPCSVSCGVGDATRSRRVLAHPRRGGKPCPPLVEKRWCGGHSECPQNFFNW